MQIQTLEMLTKENKRGMLLDFGWEGMINRGMVFVLFWI